MNRANPYAGKDVRLIYPSSPGAFPVEDVATAMGQFLGANIAVDFVMKNGTAGGTNEGANAPSDGMTVGITSIGGSLAALMSGASNPYNFEFRDLNFLGAVGNSPSVLVSSNPQIQSVEDLLKRSHCTFVAFPNSRQLISSTMIVEMFNLNAEILTGYDSSGGAAEACLRQDGDVAVIAFDQILNEDNTAVTEGFYPLLMMGQCPDGSKTKELGDGISSFASWLSEHPFQTERQERAQEVNYNFSDSTVPAVAFFMPPGTASSFCDTMRQALNHAFTMPKLRADLEDKTVSPDLISPAQIASWLQSIIETQGDFISSTVATTLRRN